MNVLVDIDGVCADFVKAFYSLGKEANESIPLYTTFQQKSWHHWQGFSREEIGEAWNKIKKSPTFWANLDTLLSWPDKMAIRKASLTPNVSLYFATSRPGYNVKQQTETWFRSIIPGFEPTILVVERMYLKAEIAKALDIHLSLEDNAENAHEIGKVIGSGNSYLIPRPYNERYNLNPSCSSVLNFLTKANVELNIE